MCQHMPLQYALLLNHLCAKTLRRTVGSMKGLVSGTLSDGENHPISGHERHRVRFPTVEGLSESRRADGKV